MNHQLYQVLSLNLQGKALTMIKNIKDQKDVNGILGWCKLMQDCSSMTSQRLQGLAQKVYSPKRCKNYSEVNCAIEEWETSVIMFAKVEERELNPTTKIYGIRQIVPEELEKDIIRASTSLGTYEKVRDYIYEQVAIRRDVKSKGPVPLELNMMETMMASMYNNDENEKEEDDEECKDCEKSGKRNA